MKDDFIVPLNGLAQGRSEFRVRVGEEFFAQFENPEILDAALDVLVEVEKSGRFIGIDCTVEGSVTVACDRCLEDLVLPVDTGFSQSIKFGPEPVEGGPAEEGGREIVYLPESEGEYDLSQSVYDYTCISLPVQRVHEDGECNPDALRYLSTGGEQEQTEKEASSTPFASLKAMMEKKK